MLERDVIYLQPETRPMLIVVIHTEEEFDWSAEHDRTSTSVTHMQHIGRAQDIFNEYSLQPTYVVDYPIASQADAFIPLKEFVDSGRALIGAHLHPWVSPPHVETVCRHNSYPGNLPAELEKEKLRVLTEQIEESFGTSPTVYLAGRYGFGPHTASILEQLGFKVDVSPAPPLDFRGDGGPDYSAYTSHPYWFGSSRRLLGIPGTGAHIGILGRQGRQLYHWITQPRLAWARLPGITSRLGILERIRLSPEDYTFAEMRRLTRFLLRQGLRIFVYSFHSPSVDIGWTPYVQTPAELQQFLDKSRRYFEYFFADIEGMAMTPLTARRYICALTEK